MEPHINIPIVPYEIWWKIAGFLPIEEVKRLYSINRPFFDAAFQERYRFADIGGPTWNSKRNFRALRRLEDKRLAKYVRVAYLRPAPVEAFRIHNIRGWRKWTEMFSNALQNMNPMRQSPAPSLTRIAQPGAAQIHFELLHNLASIRRLEAQCSDSEYRYIPFLAFISAGWASFGPNLQILQLRMPLETIYELLTASPTTLKLPDLRELGLEVWPTCLGPKIVYPDRPANLLSFINNHSDTMRALTLLSWAEHGGLYLPIGNLSHMPFLDSFTVTVLEKDFSALHDFLSAHSHQLKNLSIWLALQTRSTTFGIPLDSWSQQPVELWELRTLSLDAHLPDPRHAAGAMNCALQYSAKLTSLELKAGPFSYAQVNDLINGFAVRAKLRKLHFFTNYLSPDLLRLLSTKLPDLQDLTVKFHSIIPWEGKKVSLDAEGRAQLFCEGMKKIYVPEWAVRSLVTSPLGNTKNLQCRTALATAFPNILTFNGLERMQYLMPSGSSVHCKA